MKFKHLLFAVVVVFTISSCASIVSKSNYPLAINSNPSKAKVIITNSKNGIEVFSGETPASVNLDASDGFFSKARYEIKFIKDGYETKKIPLESKIDGWYFGNILFGGFIGMLIVDPATGAMYKLNTEQINISLEKSTASLMEKGLKIYTLNDIPNEWKSHLVKLTK